MRILVVGSGAREHALVWKLSEVAEVFCTPGNAGIGLDCQTFDVSTNDLAGIVHLVSRENFDLVVIGPEDPLISGLADDLRDRGVLVVGPGRDGAKLEASKAWSKELMDAAGVPTATYEVFAEPSKALSFAHDRMKAGFKVVVKASGAALGKGVVVCETEAQAFEAIDRMLTRAELGAAGRTIVIEDFLEGFEFSLLTLVSGENYLSLPVAQDYKRIGDGDKGPNTGGMGSYSPVPRVNDTLIAATERQIVKPMVNELKRRGIDYRGVLFSGIMVVAGQPVCLEYNVRFGDPETQSVLMRLGSGLLDALVAVAQGQRIPNIEVLDNAAVTVVLASEGYPGAIETGRPIKLPGLTRTAKIFHAGTTESEQGTVTAGGRVLAVTASAPDLETARVRSYEVARAIEFEGSQMRNDIGII